MKPNTLTSLLILGLMGLASSASDAQVAQRIIVVDGERGDYFGSALAVSGARLISTSPGDRDAGTGSGSAHVFERNDGGSWVQTAKLLAGDGSRGDAFGASADVSGDLAVVGAPFNDGKGSAYVFERTIQGTWIQVAKLSASDGEENDDFGRDVAVEGEAIVVGAPYHDEDIGGAAYVFQRQLLISVRREAYHSGCQCRGIKLNPGRGGAHSLRRSQ